MRNTANIFASLILLAGLSPNLVAAATPAADNSAQNKSDTNKHAATAQKQSNRKSDVKALAEIRKSIVDDKDLSMDAKNAKILFKNGAVTLTGPVDSDDERSKVEALAKACTCVTSVKNMLTVAPKKH